MVPFWISRVRAVLRLSPAFRSATRSDSSEIVDTTPAFTRYALSVGRVHATPSIPSSRGRDPAAVAMCRRTLGVSLGGRPERARGTSPDTPDCSKRVSQPATVGRETPSRLMISGIGSLLAERRIASAPRPSVRGCSRRTRARASRSVELSARTKRLGVSPTHHPSRMGGASSESWKGTFWSNRPACGDPTVRYGPCQAGSSTRGR